MTIYAMPALLVWVFGIGGLAMILVTILIVQKAITSSKDCPKYKSEKVVEDYYEEEEKVLDHSAISSRLTTRWKEGLKDVDEF